MSFFPSCPITEQQLTMQQRVTNPSERPSIAELIPEDNAADVSHEDHVDFGHKDPSPFVQRLAWAVSKSSYVILVVALAVSIGCIFPAMKVNDHVSQDTPPPAGSQAAEAKAFFRTHFPAQADATGFVIFSNAIDDTVDLALDERYNSFDLAVEYYSKTGSLNFSRSMIPPLPAAATTQVAAYSSYRSVLKAGFPVPVALQYLAPGNRSAFMTIAFANLYTSDNVTEFDSATQLALAQLTSDYNLTGHVESTLFSLPTFLASISQSSEGDTETMFFIVFPLSLAVFALAVSSARLLIMPLVSIAVTYCIAFAILSGIAQATPINSMAPSICIFVMLSYSLTYSFFFMSQYRKQLRRNKSEASIPEKVLAVLYTTSGRSVFFSCATVCLSGVGLTMFETDLLRSLGIAMIVVVLVTMVSVLTVIPALLASFPNFFAHSVDRWVNAIRPEDIADPTGRDELGNPLKLRLDNPDDEDRDSPLHERWHLTVVNFVAQHPQKYLFALLCIGLCLAPLSYAFDGQSSNGLDQYMPKSDLLRKWTDLQRIFRAGEVFQYNLLMLAPNEDLDDAYFKTTQEIAYTFIRALPSTNVLDFDGVSVDGTQSAYLPNGGNITSLDLGYCFTHYTEAECMYRLLVTFYVFKAGPASYFMIRLGFDPVSQLGIKWYEQARAMLPTVGETYGYKLYLYGYGADSYDTVEYAQKVLGIVAGVTVAVVFVCIAAAFGSLVIPLKVLLSTFLAVGSAFGVANLVYDHDILSFLKVNSLSGQSHSIAWQVPLMSLTICTGLVLNFEIIVLIRVFDQRWHGVDSHVAVIRGVASVGREVSVAALMSLINFGGLLANSIPAVNQIGLFFFVATAVQAFLLRLFLTPALMSTFGQWNWWPLQFMSQSCTPFAVEEEADVNPTLIDKVDYRNSMSRRARVSVMVDLESRQRMRSDSAQRNTSSSKTVGARDSAPLPQQEGYGTL